METQEKTNELILDDLLSLNYNELKAIVKEWDLVERTPANGMAYYNKSLDVTANLYSHSKKIRVYFDRKHRGKTASCFNRNSTVTSFC